MNSLKSILTILCSNDCITDALIITKGGMVIESELDERYDSESIGAFMSQVALTIKNSLGGFGYEEFTRYVMQSDKCDVYLMDLGNSALISFAKKDAEVSRVNVALFQAANEIKKGERLDV